MTKRILIIFLALFIANCAKKTNENLKKNTDQEISKMVIEGKTTKKEVKAIFGEPTEVKVDKNTGIEKWTYIHTETSMNPLNYIPVTRILIGQDGKSRTFTVEFKGDVVIADSATTKEERVQKGLLNFNSK